MLLKNLKLINENPIDIKRLTDKLKISELTAKILIHRGITEPIDADLFLNPHKQKFNDPFLMKGMTEAVARIFKAIVNHEKIIIYGDYDVDGMSATSILYRALQKLNAIVDFYIPDRSEGYGLNENALQKIIEKNFKILISVDCGITNHKEINKFKDKIDFIITDHHLPTEPLNDICVIDPHQKDCNYPDKNLCGAGVAFKLCQALNKNFQDYTEDIELAALATVADLVSLVGENRKIVSIGLDKMQSTKIIGLRELMNVSNLGSKKLNSNHIAFKIAPRLNSTGRLALAETGVKLLTTESIQEAKNISKMLNEENEKRKEIENEIVAEAEAEYRELRKIHGGDLSSIIVANENWHAGVIGLAASRLVENHFLPSIVISIKDELARASCRSIPTFHIKNALDHFKNYFIQYGGHSAAAGFTMYKKDLEKFRDEFDSYVKNSLHDSDFVPNVNVDSFIDPSAFSVDLINELDKFAPFGVDNPAPVFAQKNISTAYPKVMGQEKNHLSFFIKGKNSDVRAVSWNKANFAPLIENESLDIIFEPELNEFNGNISIQCMVRSIYPNQNPKEKIDRELLIEIYKFLKKNSNSNNFQPFNICKLFFEFKNCSAYTFFGAVTIFEELGLIQFNGEDFIMPKPVEKNRKKKLNESRYWRNKNE